MNRIAVAALAALIGIGSAWSIAGAQEYPSSHHHRHHNNRNWQNGQCYSGQPGQRRGERDNDDDDNDRDGNRQNSQYGNYGRDGRYGACNNGQYGQYGNGQYGGNSAISGQIVAVNGNRVTLQQGNGQYYGGQRITIDDQPALDNQTSGRVSTGRYVTAYGYWQNGIFYATRMQ